jgi:maleylacetate reductase
VHKGRVVFGAMDEVVFGHPAAEAIVAQMDRLGAARAFLMVPPSLNTSSLDVRHCTRGGHSASIRLWPTLDNRRR